MPDKPVLVPGPSHPITVAPAGEHVVVRAGGRVVADTTRALRLQEADYPPVLYVPREDADMATLQRSDHETYCPYKGDASYYTVTGAPAGENAVWTYETPYDAVADIREHLAFYPDRVEIEVTPA